MIRIHIRRKVPQDKAEDLKLLINQLRSVTMGTPGYIAGETLQRVDHKGEYTVISTWQSVENWQQWATSQTRIELQKQIDAILNEKTEYEIYRYG